MRIFRTGLLEPLALVSFSLVSLVGCGDDGTPMTELDAGPAPTYACDDDQIQVLEAAAVGSVATLALDTSMVQTHAQDLGLRCGNAANSRFPNQIVVEYAVPGSGAVTVNADLTSSASNFDTVLQVRRECGTIPGYFPFTCFDNTSTDYRTNATFTATGGETLFLVVTGYYADPATTGRDDSLVDEGMATLRVTTTADPEGPSLASAQILGVGGDEGDTYIQAVGTDGDGDVVGIAMELFASAGQQFDIDGDGDGDSDDVIAYAFDPAVTTTEFTASRTLEGLNFPSLGVATANVWIYDAAGNVSNMITIDVTDGELVGLGDDCSSATIFCTAPLVCTDGLCVADEVSQAACDEATPIAFEITDPTATVAAEASGTMPAGYGNTEGICSDVEWDVSTIGGEAIFDVQVPAGVWDVVLTTDIAANDGLDTVLYVRDNCVDPAAAAELGCSDDITVSEETLSTLTLTGLSGGSYAAFVELYGGSSSAADVTLRVELTPHLPGGTACESGDTCIAGTCTDGVCPFPDTVAVETALESGEFDWIDTYGAAVLTHDVAENPRFFFAVPGGQNDAFSSDISVPEGLGLSFGLAAQEAILISGTTPPAAGYVGFTPYLATRATDTGGTTYPSASLADPINGSSIGAGETIYFIVTRDQNVAASLTNVLGNAGVPASAIHVAAIPDTVLETDTVAFGAELVDTTDEFAAYAAAFDWTVWDVTPPTLSASTFSEPTRKVAAGGGSEASYMTSLDALQAALAAEFTTATAVSTVDAPLPAADTTPYFVSETYTSTAYTPATCIESFGNCLFDNSDSVWSFGPFHNDGTAPVFGTTLSATANSALIVYGVNHVDAGLATAVALTLNETDGVDPATLTGSANPWLGAAVTDRDALFVRIFALDCTGLSSCTEVAEGDYLTFYRSYLKPGTDTAPAASELLPLRAMIVP